MLSLLEINKSINEIKSRKIYFLFLLKISLILNQIFLLFSFKLFCNVDQSSIRSIVFRSARCPDLNVSDFFLWGYVKDKVNTPANIDNIKD